MQNTNNKFSFLFIAGSGIALITAITSGYMLWNTYAPQNIKERALSEMNAGNYAAALALYDKLRGDIKNGSQWQGQFSAAKKLLVAEENFLRAKIATQNGKIFEADALLSNSIAISDPSFKYYKEARAMYEEVQAKIDSLQNDTASKLESLEQRAAYEVAERKKTEKERVLTEAKLKQTEESKTKTETALDPKIINSKGLMKASARTMQVSVVLDTLSNGEIASTTWREI